MLIVVKVKLKPIGIVLIVFLSIIMLGCVESQPSQPNSIENPKSTVISTPISNLQINNPFNISCNFAVEEARISPPNGRYMLIVTGVVVNNGDIAYKYNKVGYSVYDENNVFLYADYINPVESYIAYPGQPNEFVIVSIIDEKVVTRVHHVICTARPNN